jgi:hypothetical protein
MDDHTQALILAEIPEPRPQPGYIVSLYPLAADLPYPPNHIETEIAADPARRAG